MADFIENNKDDLSSNIVALLEERCSFGAHAATVCYIQ